MTQMEVTHVPAMMGIDLTVMDVLVKVGKVDEYKFNEMQVLWTVVGYEVPKNIIDALNFGKRLHLYTNT